MTKKNNIIVIGNGIIGSTTALFFLRQGYSVTLVAPHHNSGQSATLAAGAMLGVLGEVSHKELLPVHRMDFEARLKSDQLYSSFFDYLHERTNIKPIVGKGTYIIATNAGHEDVKNIHAIKTLADAYDLSADWVEPEDIEWYHPNSGLLARKALFLQNERFISSGHLLGLLHSALETYRDKNLSILQTRVQKLIVENDVVKGVIVAQDEKLFAERIVLCAGYGSRLVLENSNIPHGILPKILGGKGTSFIVDKTSQEAVLQNVFRTPNRDFACGTHVVPINNEKIYVGATNRLIHTDDDSTHGTMGEFHTLSHSVIHELNTHIRTSNVYKVQSGIRPFTSDGKPLVGMTDIEGLFIATGSYRNGILFAPFFADLVVKELEAQKTSDENPYAAKKEKRQYYTDKTEIIQEGINHLVSFIQDPHGRLPYHREKELIHVMNILFSASILKDQNAQNKLDAFSQLIDEYQIQEIIPEIFYRLQS